ncbi:MAG: DUF6880 family protein [Phenylobacterium sp.]
MPPAGKPPTPASLKRVNAENLAALGAERLADILVAVAETRPDVKRRLRMELAAEQGADHLALEVDKRLASLETSKGRVSWRKRASFVGDLDLLRLLISERLAALDAASARERMWRFMDLAGRLDRRVKDRDGTVAEVFRQGAEDIGRMLAERGDAQPAEAFVEAIAHDPARWTTWLPVALEAAPAELVSSLLARLRLRGETSAGWSALLRAAADAAGDVEAYRESHSAAALRTPMVAAELARRLLRAGQVDDAGRALEAAAPAAISGLRSGELKPGEVDFAWESAWIDWLEASGEKAAAQAARWASFERTLSAARARDYARRLPGFEDVEAENRAFEYAAAHPDFARALGFLIDWPALPEAAGLIQARGAEITLGADTAQAWADRLRGRQPAAAEALLRKAAAAAFKRRDFKTCDRLTEAADAIGAES